MPGASPALWSLCITSLHVRQWKGCGQAVAGLWEGCGQEPAFHGGCPQAFHGADIGCPQPFHCLTRSYAQIHNAKTPAPTTVYSSRRGRLNKLSFSRPAVPGWPAAAWGFSGLAGAAGLRGGAWGMAVQRPGGHWKPFGVKGATCRLAFSDGCICGKKVF